MKEGRIKTKSKHFYDDEIEGVTTEGEVILKMGVTRREYTKADLSLEAEDEHVNYFALEAERYQELLNRLNGSTADEYIHGDIIERLIDNSEDNDDNRE